MDKSSLAHWLQRLETLHPSAMDLGLDRVATVARALCLLPVHCPVVTVAGTNGKGSTVAAMEAVLTTVGRVPGVSTSPHFQRFNERIRVAGEELCDEEIVSAFGAIDAARGSISLTYFEFAMLAALVLFQRREVDIIILEVGLGGRLDAANIVDPTVAVITSIALDHQQWLGETRGEIAAEKAGIVRPGIPVVIADPEPPAELLACVAQRGGLALLLGRDFHIQGAAVNGEWRAELQRPDGQIRSLPALAAGGLLPENICAGLQALLLLGEEFSDEQLQKALCGLQPGGRREWRQQGNKGYLLDVAHNPAAVKALHEYIVATPCKGKTIALFAPMADKDIPAMIQAAEQCFDAWFLADQPAVARASRAADNAELLRAQGCQVISTSKNVRQAFRRAQAVLSDQDRLVVFGSFFPVAEVMGQLDKDFRKG